MCVNRGSKHRCCPLCVSWTERLAQQTGWCHWLVCYSVVRLLDLPVRFFQGQSIHITVWRLMFFITQTFLGLGLFFGNPERQCSLVLCISSHYLRIHTGLSCGILFSGCLSIHMSWSCKFIYVEFDTCFISSLKYKNGKHARTPIQKSSNWCVKQTFLNKC